MTDLRELYQQLILDHNKRPRNFGKLDGANRNAEGFNPLCGDKVTVYMKVEGDVVKEISFQGSGCAISTACASVATERLKGRTISEVQALFKRFHCLVTGEDNEAAGGPDLGKLSVFSGVRDYPSRVKCATLVWHTVRAALEDGGKTVSTE